MTGKIIDVDEVSNINGTNLYGTNVYGINLYGKILVLGDGSFYTLFSIFVVKVFYDDIPLRNINRSNFCFMKLQVCLRTMS